MAAFSLGMSIFVNKVDKFIGDERPLSLGDDPIIRGFRDEGLHRQIICDAANRRWSC